MFVNNFFTIPTGIEKELCSCGFANVPQDVVVKADARSFFVFAPHDKNCSAVNKNTSDYLFTALQCNVAISAASPAVGTSFSLKTELPDTPFFSFCCTGSAFSVINENQLQQLTFTISGSGFAAPETRKKSFVRPAVRAVKHCTAQIYLHKGVFRL